MMPESVVQPQARVDTPREQRPLVSLFALPKPFEGEALLHQRNALESWRALGSDVQIMLAGDDNGVVSMAQEYGIDYLGALRRNEQGTPYLDHLFELAHAQAQGELLLYVNADILLFPDMIDAARRLMDCGLDDFLAIGRRWDLDVTEPISTEPQSHQLWLQEAFRRGCWAPIVCKDYFLFPRHLYREIPEFLVGRGNWDNWMVYQAKSLGMPVVDMTKCLTAVHQNHGYRQFSGGRLEAYVTGQEARHNESVGGGKHVVSGGSADWELTPEGALRRIAPHWRLCRDLPRFMGLLYSFARRQ